jgi:hypothetical protein
MEARSVCRGWSEWGWSRLGHFQRIKRASVLGQRPGTEAYRNVERHPEALTFPELLIWRPGGEAFFASIDHQGDGRS